MKRWRKTTRVSCTTSELGESEEEIPNPGPSMTELPRPISVDILLRLSVNRLLVCRCVCKTWRNLISDLEFAKLHFAKGEVYPLIRSLSRVHVSRTLYLVDPHVYNFSFNDYSDSFYFRGCICHENWLLCKTHCKKKLDTKLKIPLRNSDLALEANAKIVVQSKSNCKRKRCVKLRAKDHRHNVANSCRGLLCLSEPIKNDPVAVCNPITGEYINLPIPTVDKDQHKKLVDCALGFSPRTNQYKVIRMFSLEEDRQWQLIQDPITGEYTYNSSRVAEIHVLGTSSWRRIGYAPYSYFQLAFPTYLNGVLHWLYGDYRTLDYIVSFDLVNEKFQPIPPPPKGAVSYMRSSSDISLGELRGCLCMSSFHDAFGELVVWVMEDYGVQTSWTKKHRLNAQTRDARWLWGLHDPISVLSNGGLLSFHRRGSALLFYNPKGTKFKYLKIRGVKSKYEAIPYAPSFISLKDVVGEEKVQVININSRCSRLKLLGETKPLYSEEIRADSDSDLHPSSFIDSGADDCESS